ncbi:hypothetical protein [Chryseobacterium polytrichastri]|uniref:Lipoprotein n=1 Tax=Chryseobacterium polytrichastri TaxID=1302687 RepID=A0A1M7KBX7_9FLAO|nr:hypothetical protein [Chryseobacterium polytrichastri]SHM62756.1 hypothetical protein SAMN05444267_105912 [Chryseobacterium polytrichastri]
MGKNSNILKGFIIFFLITFTISGCKENSKKENLQQSIQYRKDNVVFSEIDFNKKSDYEAISIKSLVITFRNNTFIFKFIDDRVYLQYLVNNLLVTDWQQISYNFSYDSSYEDAEKSIKILYNKKTDNGFLLLPGYTEEYPVFNTYKFDKKNITYLENITADESHCLGLGSVKNKIQGIEAEGNVIFNTINEQNKNICLLKKEKKDDLNNSVILLDIQKIKESISPLKKQISIPLGEYFVDNDKLEDYGISLKISNDSIVYTESGNMGKIYNQYLLIEDKVNNGKRYLKYSKTINGYTGEADSNTYFGNIYYEKNKLFLESQYMEKKYGEKNLILQK